MRKKPILKQRALTHGPFELQAQCAEEIWEVLEKYGVKKIPSVLRHALYMIVTKLSRAVCGDHSFPDHYIDIRGYVERILEKL